MTGACSALGEDGSSLGKDFEVLRPGPKKARFGADGQKSGIPVGTYGNPIEHGPECRHIVGRESEMGI